MGQWAFEQSGYPPHERSMPSLSGGIKSPCNSPLVLPEQGGVRVPEGYLYCTGCKTFLQGDELDIDRVRKAAKRDGFKRPASPLAEPKAVKRARVVDPEKVTLNLFPSHPEHHAKLRSGSGLAK